MMIKFKNTEIAGWEPAIRGMRNPKNSWDRSDSKEDICNPSLNCSDCIYMGSDLCCSNVLIPCIGPNDMKLMKSLADGGPVHAKYRRMITVYVDITAPLYWWKEFDTYKVGTVANSCSTMHKIHAKEFTLDDFSHEYLDKNIGTERMMSDIIYILNHLREVYNELKDEEAWHQMIQLLPTSYNQKRTIMLNYEVLNNIYYSRKDHKLDEWHHFCSWIKDLPYSELIINK